MNTPILIVIAVLLSVIVAFFIAAALIIRKAVRTFQEFVTPAGEGKPSPLALFIDGASHQLAANLLMEAKASFMGTKSGEVRADKAAANDALEAMAAQNPMMAMAMNLIPGAKKNPMMAMAAAQMFAKFTGGSNNGENHKAPGYGAQEVQGELFQGR